MGICWGISALRKQLYDVFNAREIDDDASDLEFEGICAVEEKIAKAAFNTAADKRVGNKILMEDKPSYWDHFQEKLFLRMQES